MPELLSGRILRNGYHLGHQFSRERFVPSMSAAWSSSLRASTLEKLRHGLRDYLNDTFSYNFAGLGEIDLDQFPLRWHEVSFGVRHDVLEVIPQLLSLFIR